MDDILMLDDTEFLILKEQVDNGTNYIFAIATDGTNDVVFLKESTIDNEEYVETVQNPDILERVMLQIMPEIKPLMQQKNQIIEHLKAN